VFSENEVPKDINTHFLRVDGVKQPVAFYTLDAITTGRFFCWIGCSATRTILSKSANIVSESAKSESFGTFGKVISKNLLTFAVNDPVY
jgi:hypothetical protein